MPVLMNRVAVFLYMTTVTAAALNSPQLPSRLITSPGSHNISNSPLSFISRINTTIVGTEPSPSLNLTVPDDLSDGDVHVHCTYGHELEYKSCLNALNDLLYPLPSRPLTIGQRRAGGVWDLELPIRLMSGDGYCTWDIIKTGQAPYSMVRGHELVGAAYRILDECVLGNRGKGGVASNIGHRGDISLDLRPFIPRNVECLEDTIFNDQCNALVSSVPAFDTPVEIFGPEGSPLTTQILPKAWGAPGPNGCIMAVMASSGERDVHESSTFYQLWEALVTVRAMCVRKGKRGKISGLGSMGKLTMYLFPEYFYT